MSAESLTKKLVIIGDSGVGKTSLLRRCVNDEFEQDYRATIGADFLCKSFDVDQTRVTLQIWDTAGQERFISLCVSFFRGADCCVVVYDINNDQSAMNILKWVDYFRQHIDVDADFPIAVSQYISTYFKVIGNKADTKTDESNEVIAQAKEICKEHGYFHYLCSALNGDNVTDAFGQIAKSLKLMDMSEDNIAREIPETKIIENDECCFS